LPEQKHLAVGLWNYEKFGETETKCENGLPLKIYVDKDLWNSGKVKIKDFLTDSGGCSISTSTLGQLNYITIEYVDKEGLDHVIISAPFKIIPVPKPYIKITSPEPGSVLKSGYATYIGWNQLSIRLREI
jgi:hypothetical protein